MGAVVVSSSLDLPVEPLNALFRQRDAYPLSNHFNIPSFHTLSAPFHTYDQTYYNVNYISIKHIGLPENIAVNRLEKTSKNRGNRHLKRAFDVLNAECPFQPETNNIGCR